MEKYEEVIERENIKEIFENDIKGDNFIVEQYLFNALKMEHKKICYAKQEKIFVVVFEQPLKDILENKFKELEERQNARQ